MREPATATATGECNMEQVRAMESPAHCTTAGGELENNFGDLIDFFTEVLEHNSGDLIDFSTEISTCYDIPAFFHLCSGLAAGLPASSALRPCGSTTALSALVSIVACRSTSSTGLPRLFIVPPSPQDSVPPAALRHSVPPAPKDSSLPPAQPPSSVAPAPPRTSRSLPPPWSLEPRAPPWPSGSSVSPRIFGSPSLPRAPLPAAPPLSVGPLESSALPPPWLLPLSAPPWVVIMAAVWVSLCFSCSGSLLFPPWLLPPSPPPWTVLCFPELSVRPWPPELPDPPWPPEPPTYLLFLCYTARDAPIQRGA
ncbi:Arf-GAP with SH3 domain, ANK repeat and PH domain-containing protein 1 [Labeo rohita]|uniref:Arf-GAP with SH3 domain, ANK repeat and PH domain-containing protein 1 n=1 Tax=Labeo rohita TaxID=84645 RepID=A0ABQ8L3Q8_LABRO|nr:Arf-GAP with SH3 domain, ANK repeat and PH domain-containing protein 1 [Labeo rohita]